jgi:type II secretory pathway pseudopilin PulG
VIVAIGVAVFLAVTGLTAVPVIGILAAIAIPNFLVMQMRAKRSEAPANLDAIRVAERAYHAEWDEHVPVPPTPDLVPGRTPTAFEGGGLSAFQDLGWVATSPVYCRYNVITHGVHDFLATAECDIDGDGVYAVYEATPDSKATLVTSNNVY